MKSDARKGKGPQRINLCFLTPTHPQTPMTNDQIRRNDQIRMTKPATAQRRAIGHSGFGFLSSLVIGHWSFNDLCRSAELQFGTVWRAPIADLEIGAPGARFKDPMRAKNSVGALHEPAVPERGSVTRRTGAVARRCGSQSRYLFSVRHATVCRQDAGSTFGVTFRPPLNTYQSRAPTALSGSWSQCMRNKRKEATHEHPSTGGA